MIFSIFVVKRIETEFVIMRTKLKILNHLCYTDLVYGRINKKLNVDLSNDKIENMMINIISGSDDIKKIGKNWYIYNSKQRIRVTVNTYTFRIITADRI